MAEEDGALRVKRGMAMILGELETLYAGDKIGAVSIAIALRDGNVRHLIVYDNGHRIVLIGATAIAHREAVENAARDPDPGNWHMPGPPLDGPPRQGSGLSSKDGFDWDALRPLRKQPDGY